MSNVIALTPIQSEIFSSNHRFKIWVAGRGSGKSYYSAVQLIFWAYKKRGVYYYVTTTRQKAKEIMWSLIKNMVHADRVLKINESELVIYLKNGSLIGLKGAQSDTVLRGLTVDGLVIDEAAFIKEKIWTEDMRPSLSRIGHIGKCVFISTPMGLNWFYDLHLSAQSKSKWKSWQTTTAQGGRVSLDEVEQAKSEMTDRQFRQEYEASFETIGGRVYYAFDRKINILDMSKEINDVREIHVGMDFNVNPMTAVVAKKISDQLHVIDEICIHDSNTTEMCETIKNRYKDKIVYIYPDPSGKNRKTSAAVGVTDFTIIQSFGFMIDAPNAAPAVIDRVENTNRLFMNSNKNSSLFINSSNKYLIKCLDGLTYKDGGERIIDKNSNLDHAPDALGYMCWQMFRPQAISENIDVQWW